MKQIYKSDLNYHRHNRRIRSFKWWLLVIASVCFIFAIALGVDYIRESLHQEGQKTTTDKVKSNYTAPHKTFNTPYFQFQTDEKWIVATQESTLNLYVYRKLRNNFIEHELFVYVNSRPVEIKATRVLPVNITSNGHLLPLKVTGHCSEIYKPTDSKIIQTIRIQDVGFICDPNDSSYKVILGIQGGNTDITMKRPDGTTATYIIVYKNITAQPDGIQIEQIAESFHSL